MQVRSVPSRLRPPAAALSAAVQRNRNVLAAVLLAFVALVGLGQAALKPLWYDELVTFGSAAVPSWRAVWDFYAKGLDTPGPLSALLVHGMLAWKGSVEITTRLPFLAAFLVASACLYRFGSKRYPAAFALMLILLPLRCTPWFYDATEIRAYAFLLAGCGLAMVCWQVAEDRERSLWPAIGLWCSLALAIFAHFFAIFLFVPFAAAQGYRDLRERQVNWPVWSALFFFPLGYLPIVPGEREASRLYRAHFFSRPRLGFIKELYNLYSIGSLLFVFTLILLAVYLVVTRRRSESTPEPVPSTGYLVAEWVFLIVLALLPVYVVPAAMLLGAFREPYVICLNMGLWPLAVALAAESVRRRAIPGLLLLALLFITLGTYSQVLRAGLKALVHPGEVHTKLLAEVQADPVPGWILASDLPVMINDHVVYTRLFAYGQPELRAKMLYPIDLETSAPYPKAITSQANFLLFGRGFGYQLADWPSFSRQHPHFLLLVGTDPNTWLFPYLCEKAASGEPVTLRLLRTSGEGMLARSLYDVQLGTKTP